MIYSKAPAEWVRTQAVRTHRLVVADFVKSRLRAKREGSHTPSLLLSAHDHFAGSLAGMGNEILFIRRAENGRI